eukprot:1160533-Pelagomonas_calceolata.AAC.22
MRKAWSDVENRKQYQGVIQPQIAKHVSWGLSIIWTLKSPFYTCLVQRQAVPGSHPTTDCEACFMGTINHLDFKISFLHMPSAAASCTCELSTPQFAKNVSWGLSKFGMDADLLIS